MTATFVHSAYRLARAGLCLAYVYSGLSKLLDFDGAIAEQLHFGLSPPIFFAAATIAVQLGTSALIMTARSRTAAFGAAMLALFTLAASVIGHPFWREAGMERFADLNSFLEHFGLIGGFMLIALIELHGFAATEPARPFVASTKA